MPLIATFSQPTLQLSINGQAAPKLQEDLIELKLHTTLNEPAGCELLLNNLREENNQLVAPYLELEELSFGDTLQLTISDDDRVVSFSGRITRVESRLEDGKRPVFLVYAEDRLHELRLMERTRVYHEVTDAEMIESVCQDYGLTCDADLQGPQYRSVTQLHQRDLEFVQQRLQNAGGYMYVESDTLVARPLQIQASGNDELPASEFTRLSLAADLSRQSSTLGVAGWDVQAKQAIAQSSATADLQVSGITGGGILAQQFTSNDAVDVLRVPDDTQQAEAIARSLYRQQALQFVTGSGDLPGVYPGRPGDIVSLTGIGDGFSGDFLVSQHTLHHNQQTGFSTSLRLHSATLFQ